LSALFARSSLGDWKFEFISLQQRVWCEPDILMKIRRFGLAPSTGPPGHKGGQRGRSGESPTSSAPTGYSPHLKRLTRSAPPDPCLDAFPDRQPFDPKRQRHRWRLIVCPYPAEEMTCWPVSTRVGNVKNNDSSWIEPVALAV